MYPITLLLEASVLHAFLLPAAAPLSHPELHQTALRLHLKFGPLSFVGSKRIALPMTPSFLFHTSMEVFGSKL